MMEKFKDVVLNGDYIFIIFESGNRISENLLDEFMITIPAPAAINNLPVPENKPSSVTSIIYGEPKKDEKDSPIYKLLKKQKINLVDVSIKIKLNLPPKDLYSVLLDSFDDAESEIINFVLDAIDMENIKDSLADSIKKTYYTENTIGDYNKFPKKESAKEKKESKNE
jgi:hypothetical protein